MPLQPAILGTARLGNFRLGYRSAALTLVRTSRVRVTLAGDLVRVRKGSITIHDVINDAPNTCSLVIDTATRPTTAQRLRITVNSDDPTLLFAGGIDTVSESYEGKPSQLVFPCTAQDDTARVNRRIPLGYWEDTSATTVALWLVSTYAAGFTSNHVELGLPNVTVLFDGSEGGINGCLRQLAKLIGGYFYWEDLDLHLFTEEADDLPDDLDSTPGRFLAEPAIQIVSDDSQIRTRVYGKGHEEQAQSDVLAADTIIPLGDASVFNPTGGQAISESQVLDYTGTQLGGGGGLVGPGAAPSSAPALAQAAGTGVESGAHNYAFTFVTAAGESIASPLGTITVGTVAAPSSTPSLSLSSGGSVNTGDHDYEVTFVTATGETTPSAASASVTTGGAAASPPASAPTAGTPSTGGSITDGAHYYAATFVSASGETAAGPSSSTITATAALSAPSAPSGSVVAGTAGNLTVGIRKYKTTFVNSAGETTPSSASSDVTIANVSAPASSGSAAGTTGGSIPSGTQHTWYVTYLTAAGETTASSGVTFTLGGSDTAVNLTSLPTSADGRVTGRRIYREDVGDGGPSSARLITTINDNSTTSFTDTLAGASRGVTTPPGSNTSGSGRISVSSIQTGPSGTTARKVYRTVAGGATYKLLTTISDNSTTTFADNVADGSLGADAPSSNTTAIQTVPITNIPTGPSGTTSRKLYRTEAGGSQLKLLTTIANNTTTTYTDTTADGSLGANVPTGATLNTVNLTAIPLGNAPVTSRKLYRRFNGAGTFKLLTTIADNTTTTYTDTTANASLGADAPSSNTATANRVSVSGIAVGGATVTSRKLYRTAAGLSQLKLLATLADNTTTTYADSTADASLGANVPTSDTSGLVQPNGQVAAGSTSLIIASAAAFSAGGGWAVIGNGQQVIRYTGVTAAALTGIPVTGTGAITASVSYNSTVTASAALTGVSGLVLALIKGAPINVWVQRDDLAAQAELAVRESTDDYESDGIIEHRIVDERRGEDSLIALCDADLAQLSRPIVSVAYASRDVKTKSGKPIVIDITSPDIDRTLTIQDVTIDQIDIAPGLAPRFTVNASSVRFSVEDLLRRMASSLEGV